MGLCAAAGLIVLGINLFYMVQENRMRVQLYGSQINGQMAQKAALIDSVAAGAEGGADRFGGGRRAGRRLRRRILQLCGRDAGDV